MEDRDYAVRLIVEGTAVVGYVARTTFLVERARKLHTTFPIATAALGRALTLASLMGIGLKENQQVTLQIRCRGPLGGLLVQANWKGEVRGYVSNPQVILPSREKGKLNVEEAVGPGSQLLVVKDLGLREPYVGSVEVQRGGIAYDLAYYFALSEQLPSACSAGVYVGKRGEVLGSGGFIIHTPQGTAQEVISVLEANIASLGEVSKRLYRGARPEELAEKLFKDLPYRLTGRENLRYHCHCSRWRAKRALLLLGEEELEDLLMREGRGEVSCPFCGKVYTFSGENLREMVNHLKNRGGSHESH